MCQTQHAQPNFGTAYYTCADRDLGCYGALLAMQGALTALSTKHAVLSAHLRLILITETDPCIRPYLKIAILYQT